MFSETYLGTREYESYGPIEKKEEKNLEEEVFNMLKGQLKKDPSIQVNKIQADSLSGIFDQSNPEFVWAKLKNHFGNEGVFLEVKISKKIYTSYENDTKSSIGFAIERSLYFLEKEKREGAKVEVFRSPKKHLKDLLMNNGLLLDSVLEKNKKIHLRCLKNNDILKRILIRISKERN